MKVQADIATAAVRALEARFPELHLAAEPLVDRGASGAACNQFYLRVPADRLLEVMRFLRDDPELAFDQVADLAGVDYLEFPGATDRFAVVYNLLSVRHGHRLWVKCFVNDPDPTVPSVTGLWPGAVWMEREVWDMFGVCFQGHPDLRRILTWEGFEAHPLRKDYPLRGRGERESYPVVQRASADVARDGAVFTMAEESEK